MEYRQAEFELIFILGNLIEKLGMTHKKILTQMLTVFVLLSCFIVSSCVAPAAELPANVYVDSLVPNSRVAGFRVNEALNATGLLEVEATFQNREQSQYVFVYRFIWLDKNNLTIKTLLSNWKSLAVQAKNFATLRGIAPTKRAKKYRLEVYSKDAIFEINAEVNSDK